MERRIRTVWLLRQRFRRVANLSSCIGVLLAMIPIVIALPSVPAERLDGGFLTGAAGIVAVGAIVPRLAVQGVWRYVRWRNREDWG